MNETNEGNTTYARACKIDGAMEIASHLLKSLEQRFEVKFLICPFLVVMGKK
jgi:hypothetical protein